MTPSPPSLYPPPPTPCATQVTIKLCKLVMISPVPLLMGEVIFSNLGGTSTMIGDPPNILIGNMLADYVNFNSFLFNLAPGVLLSAPAVMWCAIFRGVMGKGVMR